VTRAGCYGLSELVSGFSPPSVFAAETIAADAETKLAATS
jgi:hypothetical protein